MPPTDQLLTGFNHDIPHGGKVYHVQTEFTPEPPRVETHVFLAGRVLESRRTPADRSEDDSTEGWIVDLMKSQQRETIHRLVSGEMDEDERKPEPERPVSAAGTQLELRRTLVRIIRSIRPQDPPESPEALVARLRSTATSVAVLTGKSLEHALRRDELAELLILRSEAIEWLKQSPPRAQREGQRLWSDLAQLARRFATINRRSDLVEHDLRVLLRVLGRVAGKPGDESVDREVIESLASVRGRSGRLDDFAAGLDDDSNARLKELLEGCLARLEGLSAKVPAENEPDPRADGVEIRC